MGQKYKIFINGKVLFLVENPAEVSEILSTEYHFIIQPFKNKARLKELLKILLGDINKSSMVIYHAKVEKLKDAFFSFFEYIEAAGGVVQNEDGDVLLIHRRGFWDLPKGKLEKKETREKAAVREVKEETGLKKVELLEPVIYDELSNECTFHTYYEGDQPIMKASFWYMMRSIAGNPLKPQASEDIKQAIWVKEKDLGQYISEMYPSIVDVIVSVFSIDISSED